MDTPGGKRPSFHACFKACLMNTNSSPDTQKESCGSQPYSLVWVLLPVDSGTFRLPRCWFSLMLRPTPYVNKDYGCIRTKSLVVLLVVKDLTLLMDMFLHAMLKSKDLSKHFFFNRITY